MCGRRGGDRREPPERLHQSYGAGQAPHIAADNGAEPESAAAAIKEIENEELIIKKGMGILPDIIRQRYTSISRSFANAAG
jgi:hypothetical protein